MDPKKLRHSFLPLLSDHGIPLERIALLVAHGSHLRPVIMLRAEGMNAIFRQDQEEEETGSKERVTQWPDQIRLALCLAPEHDRGHIRKSVCGL